LVLFCVHPKKEWENGFLRMDPELPENREAENYSSESAYH